MQLKAAYIFRCGCIGGALEVAREVLDPLHIVMLGLLRELADRHVFDHAPTQRADSLLGHGDAPVLSEGCKPLHLKTGRTHPLHHDPRSRAAPPYLPPERFSPVTQSGLLGCCSKSSAMWSTPDVLPT